MKDSKKILTGALIGAIITNIPFIADSVKKAINVTIGGITVNYKGKNQDFKDVKGNKVEPINYNGTIYLPIRALTNMLTTEKIEWNQKEQTVTIGEVKEETKEELKKEETNKEGTKKEGTKKEETKKDEDIIQKDITDNVEKDYQKQKTENITNATHIKLFDEVIEKEKEEIAKEYKDKFIKIKGKVSSIDTAKGANIITLQDEQSDALKVRLYVTNPESVKETYKVKPNDISTFIGKIEIIKNNLVITNTYLVTDNN